MEKNLTTQDNTDQPDADITIRSLHETLLQLNNQKVFTIYRSRRSILLLSFLKGTAFGLGSAVGATIVLSLTVYILSQIEFLPIVGEWVSELLVIIKN